MQTTFDEWNAEGDALNRKASQVTVGEPGISARRFPLWESLL